MPFAISQDLRHCVRFKLNVPVSFSWWGSEKQQQCGEGTTRDISAKGLFVWAESCPQKGAVIQVNVSIPPVRPKAKSLAVESAGVVVRTEPITNQSRFGFAVVTDCLLLFRKGSLTGQPEELQDNT